MFPLNHLRENVFKLPIHWKVYLEGSHRPGSPVHSQMELATVADVFQVFTKSWYISNTVKTPFLPKS